MYYCIIMLTVGRELEIVTFLTLLYNKNFKNGFSSIHCER